MAAAYRAKAHTAKGPAVLAKHAAATLARPDMQAAAAAERRMVRMVTSDMVSVCVIVWVVGVEVSSVPVVRMMGLMRVVGMVRRREAEHPRIICWEARG